MYIPPPEHPDEHMMRVRNDIETAERDAKDGRHSSGLTTGDKIIFWVVGVAALAGIWLLFSWLLG